MIKSYNLDEYYMLKGHYSIKVCNHKEVIALEENHEILQASLDSTTKMAITLKNQLNIALDAFDKILNSDSDKIQPYDFIYTTLEKIKNEN